jgi:hypothetical protein
MIRVPAPVRRRVAGLEISSPVPLPPGVRLLRGSWIPWIGGVFTGSGHAAAAVTVGKTIVVNPGVEVSAALVRHELEHVKQWREEGWRFPFRYAVQYLRHGYRANPYEVAARNAERIE